MTPETPAQSENADDSDEDKLDRDAIERMDDEGRCDFQAVYMEHFLKYCIREPHCPEKPTP